MNKEIYTIVELPVGLTVRLINEDGKLTVHYRDGKPFFRGFRKVYFRRNNYGKLYAQFNLPATTEQPACKVSIPPYALKEVHYGV